MQESKQGSPYSRDENNGTRHDIPNTNHLGEKGKRKEKGLKEYIIKWEKLDPKPTEHNCLPYIHMPSSSPFLLALGRPCPNSMRPRSMFVHAKAKTRNQQTSNGRKKMQRACERGIKQISKIDMASIAYGKRHDEPQDNKQSRKQQGEQVSKQTKGGVCEGKM